MKTMYLLFICFLRLQDQKTVFNFCFCLTTQDFTLSHSPLVSWDFTLSLNPVVSIFRGFPGGSVGKESGCNAGDMGLIPGLRRSSGGRHGNPFQHSYLKNPMDGGARGGPHPVHGVAESDATKHAHSLACLLSVFGGITYINCCTSFQKHFMSI